MGWPHWEWKRFLIRKKIEWIEAFSSIYHRLPVVFWWMTLNFILSFLIVINDCFLIDLKQSTLHRSIAALWARNINDNGPMLEHMFNVHVQQRHNQSSICVNGIRLRWTQLVELRHVNKHHYMSTSMNQDSTGEEMFCLFPSSARGESSDDSQFLFINWHLERISEQSHVLVLEGLITQHR